VVNGMGKWQWASGNEQMAMGKFQWANGNGHVVLSK